MSKKAIAIIGILIIAVMIFAGCKAMKRDCDCDIETTTDAACESTTVEECSDNSESTTAETTKKPDVCTTKQTTTKQTETKQATVKQFADKQTTLKHKATERHSNTQCQTTTKKSTTEPTTECTTKPTTTECTTNPTTEPTTKCTTKPTTEPTTKCTTDPTTEPTTEKKCTPLTVQEEINAYIADRGMPVDPSLTPETAQWNVMISAKDEFLLTGITLQESIEVAEAYISDLGNDISRMYCYYDHDIQSFYILYLLTE